MALQHLLPGRLHFAWIYLFRQSADHLRDIYARPAGHEAFHQHPFLKGR